MLSKIKIICTTIIAVLTMSSCAKDSAEAVAEKFTNAYHNLDFATAKKYASENSKKQLDAFEQMAEGMPEIVKKDAKKVIITMGRGQENGDEATYFYTPSDNPEPQKIRLIKENNEWKVAWNKADEIEHNKKQMEKESQTPAASTTSETLPNETINLNIDSAQ